MKSKDQILLEKVYVKIYENANIEEIKKELYRSLVALHKDPEDYDAEYFDPEQKDFEYIDELKSKLPLYRNRILENIKDFLKLKELPEDYDGLIDELEETKNVINGGIVYTNPNDSLVHPKNVYNDIDLATGEPVTKHDIKDAGLDRELPYIDKAIQHIRNLEEDEEVRKVGSRDLAKAREMSGWGNDMDDENDNFM